MAPYDNPPSATLTTKISPLIDGQLPDFVRDENEDRYITATVVSVARDCAQAFQRLNSSIGDQKQIVVDRSMIEDIALGDKTYHIILENYVIGILRGLNEA